MCGIPSTNPSPYFQKDKFKLNELCLRSFCSGYESVPNLMNLSVYFILDHCDKEYEKMIDGICQFDKTIQHTNLGINNTCLLQYDLAMQSNSDVFLFQECDYIYQPQSGLKLLEGVKKLSLVSPYDHRNFYIDKTIHSDECKIKLINDQHWRSVERNTMTFAMTNKALRDNFGILKKHGYIDNQVWHDMRANGYTLYVPIPSIATHMVKDFMAPGVDWDNLIKKIINDNEI